MICSQKCIYFFPYHDEQEKKWKIDCLWYNKEIRKVGDKIKEECESGKELKEIKNRVE
jgi:hypothetical protein